MIKCQFVIDISIYLSFLVSSAQHADSTKLVTKSCEKGLSISVIFSANTNASGSKIKLFIFYFFLLMLNLQFEKLKFTLNQSLPIIWPVSHQHNEWLIKQIINAILKILVKTDIKNNLLLNRIIYYLQLFKI